MKRVHLNILNLIFFSSLCLAPKMISANDAILSDNENVDSPITQSHGNPLIDAIAYDKEALKNYLSAQIEYLTYINSFHKTNLPLDLEIYGSQTVSNYNIEHLRFDYKLEKKKVPVYKYEWDTYFDEELIPVYGTGTPARSARDPNNRSKYIIMRETPPKLIRKKLIKKKIIKSTFLGHRISTVNTKVYSPNGQLTEKVETPIYENTRNADLKKGWYANNAQILYSIIKLGSIKNNSQIEPSINILTDFIINYGIPDNTYDLSWLVALYSNLPQGNAIRNELTIDMINKLISGCTPTGENKGMWGTVSVNPHYAYKIWLTDKKYIERHITPLELKIKLAQSRSSQKRYTHALNEKLLAYKKIQTLFFKWALSGKAMAFPRIEQAVIPLNKAKLNGLEINKIMISSLDYNIYKHYLTDIESTAIALFALRESKLNNLLPAQVIGPVFQKGKLGKPIHTKSLLTSSYNILTRSLNKNSNRNNLLWSFSEHNECQKATSKARYDFRIYERIKPQKNWIHSIMRTASISYLTDILGKDYLSKSKRFFDHSIPELELLIQTNLLTDIEEFLSNDPSALYHISAIIKHSKLALSIWHSLGNIIAPALNDTLPTDKTLTYTPTSAALLRAIEKRTIIATATTEKQIEYDECDIEIQHDRCWIAAFISFINNQPEFITHAYWEPSADFTLSKVFANCSTAGGKDDPFGITLKLHNELNIQHLKQIPYLYLGKSFNDTNFSRNKPAIIDYLTKHGGTLVYDTNNKHIQIIVEKVMKSAQIEYEITTKRKSDNQYVGFNSKNNVIHAIGINLPSNSLTAQSRAIYNSSLLKEKRIPSTIDQIILSFGKLHVHLTK